MTTSTSLTQRSRVPNGAAKRRVVVALNEEILDKIKSEAEQNLRTVSAMAYLIIAAHYGKNFSTSAATPSPTPPVAELSGGAAPATPAAFSSASA